MKVSLANKITNLYFTGSANPEKYIPTEKKATDYTKQEIDDFETTEEAFLDAIDNGHKFSNSALNFEADFNSLHGQFRMAGNNVVNLFFSGIGSFLGEKMSFLSGLGLAGASLGASMLKDIPLLNKEHSLLGIGFNSLIRGPLHILDSTFSRIGEKGAESTLPSILAGGAGIASLFRVLNGKENKDLTVPINTVGGTLGRTAIHHVDSMLASKASHLSTSNSNIAAFLSTALATGGLALPEKIKRKMLPWDNLEGFVAQGSSTFVDSLFSNIGNAFTTFSMDSQNSLKGVLAGGGFLASVPLLSKALSSWNHKIPYGTIEGRLIRGVFHAPESLVLNLGTILGNSKWGLPLSFGVAGAGGLLTLTKSGNKLLKNQSISRDTVKGLYQRLPFEFLYSLTSQAGTKLSKLLPAPLLTLFGPALSFQIGERFKGIATKYDDIYGLVLRNSTHLWESTLSSAAYRTGKMFTGNVESDSAGSILSDGRWRTEDGRIVSTMAMGKQLNECGEKDMFGLVSSLIGGAAVAYGAKYLLGDSVQRIAYSESQEDEGQSISELIDSNDSSENLLVINKEVEYASSSS